MRQVIRRFLKHLDAEKKNSYRYDLTKFDDDLVGRLGRRFLAITFSTISSGSQRSVIKSQMVIWVVPAHLPLSGGSSNLPIVQVY